MGKVPAKTGSPSESKHALCVAHKRFRPANRRCWPHFIIKIVHLRQLSSGLTMNPAARPMPMTKKRRQKFKRIADIMKNNLEDVVTCRLRDVYYNANDDDDCSMATIVHEMHHSLFSMGKYTVPIAQRVFCRKIFISCGPNHCHIGWWTMSRY